MHFRAENADKEQQRVEEENPLNKINLYSSFRNEFYWAGSCLRKRMSTREK